MKEVSRKQVNIYQVNMSDGGKGIVIGESNTIRLGYDEGDVLRILQMVLAPGEEPVRREDTLPEEELFRLLREAVEINEQRYRDERIGKTLLELAESGETKYRLEVIPDEPTKELLRVDITTDEIEKDVKDGFIVEWYTWEVVRTIELEDKTRVVVHVP